MKQSEHSQYVELYLKIIFRGFPRTRTIACPCPRSITTHSSGGTAGSGPANSDNGHHSPLDREKLPGP